MCNSVSEALCASMPSTGSGTRRYGRPGTRALPPGLSGSRSAVGLIRPPQAHQPSAGQQHPCKTHTHTHTRSVGGNASQVT